MNTVKHWLLASRPLTLLVALTTILIANAIPYRHEFDPVFFTLTACLTLTLQILSNFANDVGDFIKGTDRLRKTGPKRLLQENIISVKNMITAVVLTVIVNTLIGGLLLYRIYMVYDFWVTLVFFLMGVIAIIAAITYTIGRCAYGYYGLGDLVSLIFFGPVAILGTIFLHTGDFSAASLLPALAVGFMTAAVLNTNNLRDYENDKAAHKRTMVVFFGMNNAKRYYFLLETLAVLFLAVYQYLYKPSGLLMIGYFLFLTVFIVLYQKLDQAKTSQMIQPFLGITIRFNVLLALYFSLAII